MQFSQRREIATDDRAFLYNIYIRTRTSKGGENVKYDYWMTDEGLEIIAGWARRGLTDADISHNIGITERTLRDWKRRYPTINACLKNSKDLADTIVENALFRKATGYKTKEVSYKADSDGNLVPVSAVEKEVPPDTTAQIFWLKNRRPDLWRDRRKEADSDGQSGGVVVLPEVVADAIKTIAPPPEHTSYCGDDDE